MTIANVPLAGWAAIAIALASCIALGAVNAFGMTRIGIPSFIMTLAMLQIAAGICALLVRGQIAYAVPPLIGTLGSRSLGPVPWIVIVAALFLLVGHIVLTYTRFGRYVYMTGGNREAAEYSGVNVRMILSAVMIISALCSGVAGMLGVAYFGSAQQNEFDTYLLDSISAVVVGGTSLFGGQGGIGNTIIGLFVLGVLNNGLDHINIDSFLKILIRGLILLVALVINVYAQTDADQGAGIGFVPSVYESGNREASEGECLIRLFPWKAPGRCPEHSVAVLERQHRRCGNRNVWSRDDMGPQRITPTLCLVVGICREAGRMPRMASVQTPMHE